VSGRLETEAGGLRFQVENRRFGNDGGLAIRVYADVDGKEAQVLRFDCFEKVPHYHFDPDGLNAQLTLDRAVVPDVVAWSLVQIRDNIKPMLRAATYPAVAERVDQAAIAGVVPTLREMLQKAAQE
jgi:hypothetical protein